MGTIRKAVIPAAGLGTRFLPITKAIPKEMLPVVDKPAIHYIVQEAVEAGIEDIIIVTSRNKKAIEDYFDRNHELELQLETQNNAHMLKLIKEISHIEVQYVRQKESLGLGHAVWCARKFVGDEPFAVLLGDVIPMDANPCLNQLIEAYNDHQSSVIALQPVDWADASSYGIISGEEVSRDLYRIRSLVEKPAQPATNLAILGRYILEPRIFSLLEQVPAGRNNEIQLTDALQKFAEDHDLYGHVYHGNLYDVGDKLGYVKATIDFALQHGALRAKLIDYFEQIAMKRGGS